jgi:hypothetical protein
LGSLGRHNKDQFRSMAGRNERQANAKHKLAMVPSKSSSSFVDVIMLTEVKVFANLGLSKVGSSRFDPKRMHADLDHLDTFYIGDGWSRDGPEGVIQLDYYASSFAIQFAQLIYSKVAQADDPKRSEEFRNRGQQFAQDFVHYFDEEGELGLYLLFAELMAHQSLVARSGNPIWKKFNIPLCDVFLLGCHRFCRCRTSRSIDMGCCKRTTTAKYPVLGKAAGGILP